MPVTGRTPTGPRLRAAWLDRTLEDNQTDRDTWHTPGVDAVVSALLGETSAGTVHDALRLLSWERSAAPGYHLDALLVEVDALWTVLEPAELAPVSRRQARRWVIDAWVNAIAAERGAPCIDPLSGLHTVEYLSGRIHELDRAAGTGEPPSLLLLAVRWCEPNGPWARIAAVVRTAAALTGCVRPQATFCQVGAHTALALVPDDSLSRTERSALERTLVTEALTAAKLTVELVPVPDQRDQLVDVIERLRREPGHAEPRSSRMRSTEKSVD